MKPKAPPKYAAEIAVVRAAIGSLLSAVDVLIVALEALNTAMMIEARGERHDEVQRAKNGVSSE